MNGLNKALESLPKPLEERAKELICLYEIEELLNSPNITIDEVFQSIIKIIPKGFRYPKNCVARIIYKDTVFQTRTLIHNECTLKAQIKVQDQIDGVIEVCYTKEFPFNGDTPFLIEERRLIQTIADRLGHFIFHQRLKRVYSEWQVDISEVSEKPKPEWSVMADFLRRTDHHLYSIISRKMINHLFTKGVTESKELFTKLGTLGDDTSTSTEVNRPSKKQILDNSYNLGNEIFALASNNFSDEYILSLIQKWINEEKSHFLVKALASLNTPLAEIADAVRRYYNMNPEVTDEQSPVNKGIVVSLVRRFLTDQLEYINIAKNYSEIGDFADLLQNMIFPPESHGKLGGKCAGIFLAKKIVEKMKNIIPELGNVKTPKTWYITSDGILNFIYYNNLEDVIEQKYRDIEEIRKEYHHIVQAFKNSNFATEITNGLSRALDDFGETPIIVRSSSLLEDRIGTAFAGKYKSLFLANQGTKQERLEALMDAIAEVYASTFGPDPIGYRIERGLIDFNEEMGIMIQEVVGRKVGNYFFPAFAGVAFSNNEFRWSPRIKREDGLLRIVPGLGTRAVDRIGDDYPVLIAPGQPSLRVNLSFEEIIGYSPKNIDVINLETNTFETIPIKTLIKNIGNSYPIMNDIFSIVEGKNLKKPVGLGIDANKHEIIVTFENMISNTKFINQINALLKVLKDKLGNPVDVEFASNGNSIYLLQCRPQSSSFDSVSAIIPKDISRDRILFTANRFVSNGRIPDINYIVYVDPQGYSDHSNLEDLKTIGNVIGILNEILPKKRFILMGPGRWGSRGDIRLGVRVTYADIKNTSLLIEIARKKGNYVPDLSFGTHFFQDLVESAIRYLPLYPDETGNIFTENFFHNSENLLKRLLPEYGYLSNTIKVINVSQATKGLVLRVLMNADDDEAMGIFVNPSSKAIYTSDQNSNDESHYMEPSEWRIMVAELIAKNLDPSKFGVKGIYLFGTTYNKSASDNSDIDIMIHFDGSDVQKELLKMWFEGWDLSLRENHYLNTGYKLDKLLDIHIITDTELKQKKYYADIVESKNINSKKLTLKTQ